MYWIQNNFIIVRIRYVLIRQAHLNIIQKFRYLILNLKHRHIVKIADWTQDINLCRRQDMVTKLYGQYRNVHRSLASCHSHYLRAYNIKSIQPYILPHIFFYYMEICRKIGLRNMAMCSWRRLNICLCFVKLHVGGWRGSY